MHDEFMVSGNSTMIHASFKSTEPVNEGVKALIVLLCDPDLDPEIGRGHGLRALWDAGLRLDAHARNGKPRLP